MRRMGLEAVFQTSTFLVVPCYNEEKRLDRQAFLHLAGARADLTILFVDDGSTDNTFLVLEEIHKKSAGNVLIHRLAHNAGKAEAIRQGMLTALRLDAACIGYTDADLSTPPEELLRMLSIMDTEPADILVGTRVRLPGCQIERKPIRHLLGRAFSTIASIALRTDICDTQCGAKFFFRTAPLEKALATPFISRWAIDVEMLARIFDEREKSNLPHNMREIPLRVWREVKGSKLKPGAMLWAGLELIVLMLYRRFHVRESKKFLKSHACNARLEYLSALIVGIALAYGLFTYSFIMGRGFYWLGTRSDAAQQIIGLRYFVADSWRFPIFRTALLSPPNGVNIIFTDSIPLAAVFTKLFRWILPKHFHYFGIWFLISWLLQPIITVFAVRSSGIRNMVPVLAAAILASLTPALWFRYMHVSLCSHFLILLSLGLYFITLRNTGGARIWLWWGGLANASLLVHPYLAFMVLAIFGAGATALFFNSSRQKTSVLTGSALVIASVAFVAFLAGHFQGYGDSFGYGYFSMNLLSPVFPQISGVFGKDLPLLDATGGQYEGFNYLGIGTLSLIFLAVLLCRSRVKAILRRDWALIAVLSLLFVLALSNKIFIGTSQVLDLGPAPRLLDQFRSSGRFFWPIGYALLVGAIAVVWTRLRPGLAVPVLAVAVVLQWIDTQPMRERTFRKLNPQTVSQHFKRKLWVSMIGEHRKFAVIPSPDCGGKKDALELLWYASVSATPANDMYLARRKRNLTECSRETSLKDRPMNGELLVLLTPLLKKGIEQETRDHGAFCRTFQGGMACSTRWSEFTEDLSGQFTQLEFPNDHGLVRE